MKKRNVRSLVVGAAMLAGSAGASGQVVTRVNVTPLGGQSTGGVACPSISANGRYVAFSSPAADLVSGDTNGKWDVFVRDLQTGVTQRVSVSSTSSGSVQGDDDSGYDSLLPTQPLALSTDGRHVVFLSRAKNLVSGTTDPNNDIDVFVRDLDTGVTTKLPDTTGAMWASIDPDGSHAFAGGLGGGYGGMWDRSTGTTVLALNMVFSGWSRDGKVAGRSLVYSSPPGVPQSWNWVGVPAPGPQYFSEIVSGSTYFVDFSDDGLNGLFRTFDSGYFANSLMGPFTGGYMPSAVTWTANWIPLQPRSSPSAYMMVCSGEETNTELRLIERTSPPTEHVFDTGYDSQPFATSFDGVDIDNDGTVVTISAASNMMAGDTNGTGDVFLVKNLVSFQPLNVELAIAIDTSDSAHGMFTNIREAIRTAVIDPTVVPRGSSVALRISVFGDDSVGRMGWTVVGECVCPVADEVMGVLPTSEGQGSELDEALENAAASVEVNPYRSDRQVLLIIGDGGSEVEDDATVIAAARARALYWVDEINAVCIGTDTALYDVAAGIDGTVWISDTSSAGDITGAVHTALRAILNPPCVADLNRDDIVDFLDYLAFLGFYDESACEADLNGDCNVDFLDQLEFLTHFDDGC